MDGQRFDEIAKGLAHGVNRRRVLRGMGGVIATAVALRTRGIGAEQQKRAICHFTGSANNPWEVITVAKPAWNTHFAHGDTFYINCCDDSACSGYDTCGGDGVEGECGCTPTVTADNCDGVTCGDNPNGCGETVTCGCSGFDTCGGGGTDGQCGCTARTSCATGETGQVDDGCGGSLNCGCGSYVLAGAGGISSQFTVDDDLVVYLNNDVLFADTNVQASVIGPISFSADLSSEIRFEATNSYGECQSLEPVTLYCADDSANQVATAGHTGDTCDYPASTTPFFTDSVTITI